MPRQRLTLGDRLKIIKETKLKYFTGWSTAFLIFVAIDFVCIFVACIAHIATSAVDLSIPYSPIFLTLMVLLVFFALVYFAIDALLDENAYELFGFILVSFVLRVRMIWSAIEQGIAMFSTDRVSEQVVIIVTVLVPAGVSIICQIAYVLLFFPIRRRLGFKLFELYGSSPIVRSAFQATQSYLVVLKLELLLVVTVIPTMMFYVHYRWIASYVGFLVYILLSVVCYVLVIYVAMPCRSIFLQAFHILFCLVEPGYFVYKIVAIWIDLTGNHTMLRSPQSMGSDFSDIQVGLLLTIIMCVAGGWRLIVIVFNVVMIGFYAKTEGEQVKRVLGGYPPAPPKEKLRAPLVSDSRQ